MGGISLIVARDLRDLSSTLAFRVVAALLVALALALAAGGAALILGPPPSAQAGATMTATIGMIFYFATLLPFLVLIWAFAGPILVKEKSSGHLETLLATPPEPEDPLARENRRDSPPRPPHLGRRGRPHRACDLSSPSL